MKKNQIFTFIVLLISVFVFSQVNAADKQVANKIGDKADDVPCKCIFNQNRMWNPEKIVWNNLEWYCTKYNDEGLCEDVNLVNDNDRLIFCSKDPDSNDQKVRELCKGVTL